jgi:predicted amidohydrolase YtcJ
LITHAEIYKRGRADLRIEDDRVTDIGSLQPKPGERVLDAQSGALLPGLHDHHIHLLSYAASLDSVRCGPPEVVSQADLIQALRNARPTETGWIRGFGYHHSVAGEIDRHWLDRHGPEVPIRIQHRSGRLWILNGAALDQLPAHVDPCGRLYDQDLQLRDWLPPADPAVREASERLASYGVTHVTDMSPGNDNASASLIAALQRRGDLMQHVQLAGTPELETGGPTKIHLHESALPTFEHLCSIIRASHAKNRNVAVHCVTEAELVFTLAAIREASPRAGDRIEHASVTPPALLEQIRELGLSVVTQPNFIAERGDAYLTDVPECEHPWLYRCRGFLSRGIPLAGGTDAPFGHPDPWRAMSAAVTRRTANGQVLGPEEALTPEDALALFLDPDSDVEGAADLCLLDACWAEARDDLAALRVRATIRSGELIYDRDTAPFIS